MLLAGQDLIYHGRFSAAALYFTGLAARYPREAAPRALRASALIWDAEADGDELLHADTIDAVLGEAIARGQIQVDSAPDDYARSRALFWLGTAYGYRARQAELRGAAWRASRDARAMHQALERALALDSACADCLLPLGLYDYALARAGSLARLVARIIGLGSGDVTRGLERIRRAGEAGTFSRWEARWVYASMLLREADGPDAAARREDALRIIADLAARFPENVVFRRALEAPVPGP
jgi:hypothetical protein